jgi:hypothetical protein
LGCLFKEYMLKLKSFIYRFTAIFGRGLYLANKEEQAYIDSQNFKSELSESIARGCWQGGKGFTTVWTYKQPFCKSLVSKIQHAFDKRYF